MHDSLKFMFEINKTDKRANVSKLFAHICCSLCAVTLPTSQLLPTERLRWLCSRSSAREMWADLPPIGEMSVSFKGFIVSKPFTGIMLCIYTVNKRGGVIKNKVGQSDAASAPQLFALSSYGSILLLLLSLSQCGICSFFSSFSLAIWITQNNFTEPLLLSSAAAICCLPPLYNQNKA